MSECEYKKEYCESQGELLICSRKEGCPYGKIETVTFDGWDYPICRANGELTDKEVKKQNKSGVEKKVKV